ncbi:hypothetical protein DPMN_001833 [Dreissena polymorpha]|uniref:Uncharacterized protein n=3 Tax=Dreissena polymorpha TaxID=45954 RepID=A0A9D4MJ39_DREPO|nr:hypothetical protein DPMN_001833 [Dreissena polymorpha]
MFDEYVMYVVENLHNQEKAAELLRAVKGEVNSHFVEALLTSVTPNEECDGPQRASRLNPGLERGSVIKGPCAEMTLHEQLTGSSNTNYFGPAESDYMSQTSYKANGFPISSNCPSNSPVMSPAYSPRSNIATIPCPTGNGGMKPGYMTCTEHIPNAYNNNDWPPSSFPGMPGEKIDYEHVPCYKISGGFMDNVPSSHTQVQCYDPGYKRHLPSGHVTNGGYTEAVDIGRSGMPEVYPYHVTNLT